VDTLEAIHTRRSIRRYQDKPVSADLIEEIIGAAMMAPSAGNVRPWQFIVLTDQEVRDKVPAIHPHASMTPNAPVAIMICGDLSLEKYPGNWIADCSAATQNLLLAAHAKGLGAVWTGLYPEQERIEGFRQLLGLPEHVVPLVLVPMGYPDRPGGSEDRYEEAKIHYNRW